MAKNLGEKRFQIFDALLGCFPAGRLIDLGAGHGLFSQRAADAGWDVTAVDARTERFKEDPRVTWVREDIRTTELARFDLILCLGLFYHLTVEDQLQLLEKTSGIPLMLDTHVAGDDRRHFPLSDYVIRSGYRGRLYAEEDPSRPQAAWGNESSFWPTPDSLYRMLDEAGYPIVLTMTPWYRRTRTFFLCLPPHRT